MFVFPVGRVGPAIRFNGVLSEETDECETCGLVGSKSIKAVEVLGSGPF